MAASTASVSRDGDRIAIDGTLDFHSARRVLEQVAPAIASTASVIVDLAGVVRSNSAGLALMIEWLALARGAGHSLRFSNVPDGLLQLARVCEVEFLIRPDAGT